MVAPTLGSEWSGKAWPCAACGSSHKIMSDSTVNVFTCTLIIEEFGLKRNVFPA